MTHLEFVDKLNESGISVRATNVLGKSKTYPVSYGLNTKDVVVDGFSVRWAERMVAEPGHHALESLIAKSIDMDSWKHSWHKEIKPHNYEDFRGIIANKILDRAKQIEELFTVYFILAYEISGMEGIHNE